MEWHRDVMRQKAVDWLRIALLWLCNDRNGHGSEERSKKKALSGVLYRTGRRNESQPQDIVFPLLLYHTSGGKARDKMNRQRTRRERAARWAEFWATLAVGGCIGLVWLFGVCCGFAIVQAAW